MSAEFFYLTGFGVAVSKPYSVTVVDTSLEIGVRFVLSNAKISAVEIERNE